MVTRLENWPLKLSAYLRSRRALPFAWGGNDCLTFAAGGVQAVTGIDFKQGWPDYATQADAEALLSAHGGIEAIISDALQVIPHAAPRQARRGDVAAVPLDSGMAAGLVDDSGRRVALVTEQHGLTRFPLAQACLIWSY